MQRRAVMDYSVSRQFHDTYENLYEHIVVVTLQDGTTVEGGWYDEFFEDTSILISTLGPDVKIIKLSDIKEMKLSDKD